MTYLKEIGLRIPEDVQIAGIGDGVPGKIVEPKRYYHAFLLQNKWDGGSSYAGRPY